MTQTSSARRANQGAVWERPALYPKQRAFVDDQARITVVEAATKVGKTVGMLIWLIEQALMGKKGQNFWWVAPVYTQSKDAFDRLKLYLTKEAYLANEADLKATLINGAIISFKSGDNPDSLYGADVYGCVIDEATRCDEDVWTAIQSTMTFTKGRVKIIGNVRGRHNWAYTLARQAEGGTVPNLSYYRLTVWDAVEVGLLDRAEIEQIRKTMRPEAFKELYEAIPSDDAGNPFGIQAIESCIQPRMSDGMPVVWGWDVARAQDWTVGVGLDQHGQVCRFERWQAPWRATVRDIVAITRNVRALVDSTGVGDVVLEFLQAESHGNFEGFHFTGPSKQNLMERLMTSIQQSEIGYPPDELPHRPLVKELKSFEYQYVPTGVRYSAPSGHHDDCVIALSLALWHWRMTAPIIGFYVHPDGSDEEVRPTNYGDPRVF